MKRPQKNNTVADKVDAVISLHLAQNPGVSLSVSALARRAGVSRANLYASHRQLLEKLPKKVDVVKSSESRSDREKMQKLRTEIAELRRINKALLFLNVELRGEVVRLKRRSVETSSTKKFL